MQARIESFDVLKGVAILMVVMGHVITYGVYRIDNSVVFRLIGTLHMPLFFFISGYFTFRERDRQLILPNVTKRFMQLIVPMVAVSSLWIFYYPHSGLQKHLVCTFGGLWGDMWKNGYWFTFVLFVIILLYGAAAWFSNRISARRLKWMPFAALLAGLAVGQWLLPKSINAWLSFTFVFKYMWVFLFGGMAKLTGVRFFRIAESQAGYTVSLVVTVAGALFVMYPEWLPFKRTALMLNVVQVIMQCSLAVFAIGLCHPLVDVTKRRTLGMKLWSLSGRRSLQIYLLHYFFLFPMTVLRPWLRSMGLDFVPVTAAALIAAALIIVCCLGVDAVLRRSRILGLIIGHPLQRA